MGAWNRTVVNLESRGAGPLAAYLDGHLRHVDADLLREGLEALPVRRLGLRRRRVACRSSATRRGRRREGGGQHEASSDGTGPTERHGRVAHCFLTPLAPALCGPMAESSMGGTLMA